MSKVMLLMLGVLAEPVLATKFPSARIRTAVIEAINVGNTEALAAVLAKNGLDVDSPLMRGGYTVLHEAALTGSPEVVGYLIEQGADVNVIDNDGYTPLDNAILCGKAEVAALLEQAGAIGGETPTSQAALAYDAVLIVAQAIGRAGSLDGTAIRDEIAATVDYSGATRLFGFTDDRHAIKPAVVEKIGDGRRVFTNW